MDTISQEEYHRASKELVSLLNTDPRRAVDAARELRAAKLPNGFTTDFLKGSVFVNAGHKLRDITLVGEGRTIFERFQTTHKDDPDVVFRLANALSTEIDLTPFEDVSWYVSTADTRARTRRLFKMTSEGDTDVDTHARALTNLASELWRGNRWVEAYDTYLAALDVDQTNAVASTGAARIIIDVLQRGFGDEDVLKAVAARHIKQASLDRKRLAELAGPSAAKSLEPLLSLKIEGGELPDLSNASDYERFVAEEHLALAPTIAGLEPNIKRWDSLALGGVIETLKTCKGVPPVFAIFNVAKADFLAARWACFLGLHGNAPETGRFADTLDYANYGTRISMLTLAQRASLDVLDRIAVFVAEYLGLDESPRSISFRTRWHKQPIRDGQREWHPGIQAEVEANNRGFIALADVAIDLTDKGFLSPKVQARHTGTHRVPVLHDLGSTPSRPSKYVTHFSEKEFVGEVLETLRLTRASLIYLVDAVATREARVQQELKGRLGHLYVPDHDWVRGDDD